MALQIRDVILMRRQVDVRRTLVRTSEGWKDDSPRPERSIRSVPLRRELAAALQEYISQHPHRANPQASLWPGRNYGGYGEWRGALDWDKSMGYDSFDCRRFRPPAVKIGQPNWSSSTCRTRQQACLQAQECRWLALPASSGIPTPPPRTRSTSGSSPTTSPPTWNVWTPISRRLLPCLSPY